MLSPKSLNILDFEHESASHHDSETSSLVSFQIDHPSRRSALPSSKLLPLIGLTIFVITNIIPISISCGIDSHARCYKLHHTLEIYPAFKWIYIVNSLYYPIPLKFLDIILQIGNLFSTITSIGTIGILYSYMKKRFSVPEYQTNLIMVNLSYPSGVFSIICSFIYAASNVKLTTKLLQGIDFGIFPCCRPNLSISSANEDVFLKMHLTSMLAFNTINLYLLSTLERDKTFVKKLFAASSLFKFKRMVFAFSSATISLSKVYTSNNFLTIFYNRFLFGYSSDDVFED